MTASEVLIDTEDVAEDDSPDDFFNSDFFSHDVL